tara:strand:+ start:181 stop:879 length:699 start_codon:yes stop_codon:yes gene_type:complete
MADKKELQSDNVRETHWLGEVVKNDDHLKLGRCKVKVYGKFDNLEDDAVPWATPMNRDHVGAHSIPRVGDIVAVRFDNGNIYHPEYWFHIDQNKDLKTDILEASGEAHNVVSLIYDAERNVRIYHSPEDGLVITRGSGAKERPLLQIDEANMIKISTDADIYLDAGNIYLSNTGEGSEDKSEPAVRGHSLEEELEKFKTNYDNHIHPTPMGPSGKTPTPWITDHESWQQENK